MPKIIIAAVLCLVNLSIANACSCGGYINQFCYSADTSDYIALVELLEFEEFSGAQFKIIENLNKKIPDTISVLGQDGLNCNLGLSQFNVGDTLILNLDFYDGDGTKDESGNKIYEWGVYNCNRHYLLYSEGLVNGAIDTTIDKIEYINFKENLMECLDFTLSIKETSIPDIKIFPNPSNHLVNFSISSYTPVKIGLFDISGNYHNAEFEPQSDGYTFDISHLNAGIYFIKIKTSKGILSRRLLKI